MGGKTVKMAQFSAIMRSFGIRYGFYDALDWKCARYADPIVDQWGDLMKGVIGVAFAPDDEARGKAAEALVGQCVKMNELVEDGMRHHSGKYAAGECLTIADFVLASYIGNFIENKTNPIHE